MRIVRVVTAAIAVLALAACHLPTVPDETAGTVEGPHVAIVSRQVEPNPTDQWNYTYVMLEVTGPEPRVDSVASALHANGWNVYDSSALLLTADLTEEGHDRPVVDLSLVQLGEFLRTNRFSKAEKRFSQVPTRENSTYYVAILTPLTE